VRAGPYHPERASYIYSADGNTAWLLMKFTVSPKVGPFFVAQGAIRQAEWDVEIAPTSLVIF